MSTGYKYLLIIVFLLCYSVCISAELERKASGEEIIIEADELIYNKKEELVSARGNVYIQQKDLQLVTDKVVYDKNNQYLYAIGNLAFRNDNKNVLFGKKAFFNRKKNTGIIIRFKARLSQKGLLSSDFAQMLDKKNFLVRRLVFSTCKVCKDNPIPYTPLWQIRAKEALINQKEEKIEYRHSRIELFGVPIFYFPYFVMPTPRAGRRSGFLHPKIKKSNVLGVQVSVPYYFNLLPYMDLIYTPTFSDREGILNRLHFRHLTRYGLYNIDGLFIYTDKTNSRSDKIAGKILKGLFKSEGNFKFKNNYFLDYQLQKVFDNTKKFTEKYNITKDDVLLSKISARREKKDQLLMLDTLSFQDLREEMHTKKNNTNTSYVLPWIRTYNKLPVRLPFNSKVIFSSDLLNLRKKEDISYKRGTLQLDILSDIHLPLGQILNVNPAFRYDYHDISKSTENTRNKDRTLGKLFVDWKWPFIKQMKNKNVILEPIVNFTYNSLKTKDFFNKDSRDQSINIINMFSSNFFTSKDTPDLGSRVNYGLRTNYYADDNIYGIILGQSYKLNQPQKSASDNASYIWNNKLKTQKTAIAGKMYMQFGDKISFVNNFSLNPNHLDLIKNEFDVDANYKNFKINLNHIFIGKKYINEEYNGYNQEVGVALQYNFYKNWGIKTRAKRKLGSLIERKSGQSPKKKWVNNEVGLFYKGDCLNVNFGVERDYSKPRGLKSSVTTYLTIEPLFN